MRDPVLALLVFGSLPFIVVRPWIGALMWAWLGLMNPHRLTWGFAINMPFAQLVALATLGGMLISREKMRVPWSAPVVTLLLLVAWMSVTTVFAIDRDEALLQLEKVMKIQLMTFVTLMLINDQMRLKALLWVIAFSLGFYGVKGGIFTATHGGGQQVLGPEGSFISGNTEIGLALIMVLPLLRYLQLNAQRQSIRWGMGAAMLLTGLAILGTQSRGALIGGAAMGAMLWFKSRKKALLFVVMIAAVPSLLLVMPDSWYDRMATIGTYEQDASAMGRIHAWEFSTRMAIAHPLTGGGFASYTPMNYATYAPDIPALSDTGNVADAHSIYFQMLGHHGFVGLGLFLALLAATWGAASSVMRLARARPDLKWAYDLAAMCQVSLFGFMVAGAFLGLAYFDLTYTLIIVVAATRSIVEKELASPRTSTLQTTRAVESLQAAER